MQQMSEMLKDFGARVRAARRERGLTVQALAAVSRLSPRFIAQIEAGAGNISIMRLAQLAEALSISPQDLIAANGVKGKREVRLIALVGLRGAGKSTIGALLAKELSVPFIELDSLIERAAGMSLGEVFSLHGEDYYRRLESEQLALVLKQSGRAVIAAGGSIVSDHENWDLLKRRCFTIWLRATPKDHMQRVIRQGDTRPMRDNPAAMSELRALLERREPLYAESDLEVKTSGRKIQTVVDRIIATVGKPASRLA